MVLASSNPNNTEPAINPAGLEHIATLTEALRQIAEGCAGNSGRCEDCDSAARVAANALAGDHLDDHSPASSQSREP